MDTIFNKTHYRQVFYWFVAAILVISQLLRYFVLPMFDENLGTSFVSFLATIIDSFTISLLVTVIIGGFIFWITPELVKKSVMDVIAPKEIGPLLKKATSDSKTWIYKGACGRYNRATTIPMMASAARQQGIGRDIRMTLLDPINEQLCDEYSIYRRSLKSAKYGSKWTKEKVQQEVIATVLSALRFKHEEPLLRIEIYLTNHFSAFRVDISDEYAVVTKEDSDASGLRADKSTYFYDSYLDDCRLCERQSKKVDYNDIIPLDGDLNSKNIVPIIEKVFNCEMQNLKDLELDKIVAAINSPTDPYA